MYTVPADLSARADASLRYLTALGVLRPEVAGLPMTPYSHPAGIVVDHQLFSHPGPLAAHLNARYCLPNDVPLEAHVPNELGVPLYAPDESDMPALARWYQLASYSPRWPFPRIPTTADCALARRAPNAAAAYIAITSTAWDTNVPQCIFRRNHSCAILFDAPPGAWFLANLDHWDDEQMFQELDAEPYPGEGLESLLDALTATGQSGIWEFRPFNAVPPETIIPA